MNRRGFLGFGVGTTFFGKDAIATVLEETTKPNKFPLADKIRLNGLYGNLKSASIGTETFDDKSGVRRFLKEVQYYEDNRKEHISSNDANFNTLKSVSKVYKELHQQKRICENGIKSRLKQDLQNETFAKAMRRFMRID